MDAQTEYKKEVAIWQTKVKSGFPAIAFFSVLCSYTEVFTAPFKFSSFKVYTYKMLNTSMLQHTVLRLRKKHELQIDNLLESDDYFTKEINVSKSFWKTVGNFFKSIVNEHHGKIKEEIWETENVLERAQERQVLNDYPEFFEFASRTKSKLKYGFELDSLEYRGLLTGRYYFDYYGYLWLEIYPYFIPDYEAQKKAWVRETAIKYKGKEEVQAWINASRSKPEQSSNKTKRNLSLLLPLALTLFSK